MTSLPLKELVQSLMFSNLVYIDQIDEITRVIGYPQVTFLNGVPNGKDTQGYVLREGRNLFVIFRGTQDARDFINDIEAVVWDSITFDSTLKVHRGFHAQYKAIENQLNEYLMVNNTKFDTITFCGHSLGAALATIATVYFYYNNMDPYNPLATKYYKTVKVQTYGCPRLGDAAFGQYYTLCVSPENHWRVFNETDPAAEYPCQTSILSSDIYVHVPGNALCLIGSDPVSYQIQQVDNQQQLPVNFVKYLDQHHTALYMSRLLSLYNQEEEAILANYVVVEVVNDLVTEVMRIESNIEVQQHESVNTGEVGGCVVC